MRASKLFWQQRSSRPQTEDRVKEIQFMIKRSIPRICGQCSKPFMARTGEVNRGKAKYCSRQCGFDGQRRPLAVRFTENTGQPDSRGCQIFGNQKIRHRYKQIYNNDGQPMSAHRAAWQLYCGQIPEGLLVLHRCDVMACVNPEHLFLGTQQDNMDDMIAKGRKVSLRGEAVTMSKLTENEVRAIRALSAKGVRPTIIAQKFKTSRTNVHHIVNRDSWKHVK